MNDISNYRLISLLPSIFIEKLIFKQLSRPTYLNEHILLYDRQYDFRKGLRITQDFDKGKIPISFFLDLQKALFALNHVILLQKLNHIGIKSVELKLLKVNLQNIMQCLHVGPYAYICIYVVK